MSWWLVFLGLYLSSAGGGFSSEEVPRRSRGLSAGVHRCSSSSVEGANSRQPSSIVNTVSLNNVHYIRTRIV